MDNRFYFGFNTSEERKKRRKAELYSMSEKVSTFFWDEAPQHGLEMREGQQDMSFEIVDALINDQHFAIEAGVGIGNLDHRASRTALARCPHGNAPSWAEQRCHPR